MRQIRKKKSLLWTIVSVLILAALAGGIALSISSQAEDFPQNPINGVNTGRSQELVVGTGLSMDKKQKQIHKKEERIHKTERQKEQNAAEGKSKKRVSKKGGSTPTPGNTKEKGNQQVPGEQEEGQAEKPDEPEDPPEPEDPTLPTIKTNLKQGEEIGGGSKGFWIKASDYKGRYIGAGGLSVQVNGKKLYSSGDSGSRVNYNTEIRDGKNTIQITATDSYDKSKTVVYTVIGDAEKEGEVEGTITLSVEAHTIGKGYILAPTKVEVIAGQPLPYTVDRVLKEQGMDYDSTGSLNSGFYLSRIYKPGITAGYKIPDELLQKAEAEGVSVETQGIADGSLGATDFTKHSGWTYQANGSSPDFGMSGYIPKDGDEIRIRFTLYFGYDLGGSWGDYPS